MRRFYLYSTSSLLVMALAALSGSPQAAPKALPDDLEPFQFDFDGNGSIGSIDLLCFLKRWGLQDVLAPTPTPTETSSGCENRFKGTYQANFSGASSGTATITIDAMGSATGTSTSGPVRSTIEGALSLDGDFFAHLREQGQIIGIVFGKFSGNSGSGQWRDFEGESGSWSATRNR